MDNNNKLIPEEKLLHIIEDANGAPIANTGQQTKSAPKKKISFKLPFSFSRINLIVTAVLLVATIWLVAFFYGEINNIQKRATEFKSGNLPGASSREINVDKGAPEIKDYLSHTKENNPFHLLPQDASTPRRPSKKPTMNLSLVGIFWDDQPQAIIEDLNNSKDYMVFTGDSVGVYKVGKITSDSVELISNEENKILR